MPPFLTVAQVAARYQKRPKTIYTWVGSRLVPHLKINGSLYFRLEDLEAWEKSLSATPILEHKPDREALPRGRRLLFERR